MNRKRTLDASYSNTQRSRATTDAQLPIDTPIGCMSIRYYRLHRCAGGKRAVPTAPTRFLRRPRNLVCPPTEHHHSNHQWLPIRPLLRCGVTCRLTGPQSCEAFSTFRGAEPLCIGGRGPPAVEEAASSAAVQFWPELTFQLHQAPDLGPVSADVGLDVGGRLLDGSQVDAE
jgi:hypothetical protein